MNKVLAAGGLSLLLALAGLWFYGRPAYRHYKEKRFLLQAQACLAKGDYKGASLSVRQILAINQRNLEALSIRAELAQIGHSPLLLDCRRDIAEIAPTLENKLLLASAALAVESPPFPLAVHTLQDLNDSASNAAPYHVVAAELALKQNKLDEAAAQFETASRLEPENEMHQLNVAVLRLQSTNAATADEARATLKRLRDSTNVGGVALRWLVSDGLRRKDLSEAENYSGQLLTNAECQLDDR